MAGTGELRGDSGPDPGYPAGRRPRSRQGDSRSDRDRHQRPGSTSRERTDRVGRGPKMAEPPPACRVIVLVRPQKPFAAGGRCRHGDREERRARRRLERRGRAVQWQCRAGRPAAPIVDRGLAAGRVVAGAPGVAELPDDRGTDAHGCGRPRQYHRRGDQRQQHGDRDGRGRNDDRLRRERRRRGRQLAGGSVDLRRRRGVGGSPQ